MNFVRPCAAAVLALACLTSGAVFGEDAPDAEALLRDSMAFVGGLDALSVNVDLSAHLALGEMDEDLLLNTTIMMRGEQDLFFEVEMGENHVQVFASEDGRHLYDVGQNSYQELPAQMNRLQLITGLTSGPLGLGLNWVGQYLHDLPALLNDASEWRYHGEEEMALSESESAVLQKLSFQTENYDAEVWLAKSEHPKVRRVSLDASKMMKKMGEEMEEGVLQLVTTLQGWESGNAVDGKRFAFTPPEDATRLPSPSEMAQRGPQDPMLGKPAPSFALDFLGGGSMDLASHKGKDIVILDFWATWCGPCRMVMPALDEVAKEFADKGVKVYAVNQREDAEQVSAYMERSDLSLTVALDRDGKVGDSYAVRGIPRTIIVGKDGIVRGGHEGASPRFKEEITAELNALLQDGDAEETES